MAEERIDGDGVQLPGDSAAADGAEGAEAEGDIDAAGGATAGGSAEVEAPGLLSTRELAERLGEEYSRLSGRPGGITPQTILNWKDAGMPMAGSVTAAKGGRGGGRGGVSFRFDLEVCRRWMLSNRHPGRHGGKRRKAGRPPGSGKKQRQARRTPPLPLADVELAGDLRARAEEILAGLAAGREVMATAKALLDEIAKGREVGEIAGAVDFIQGLIEGKYTLTDRKVELLAWLAPERGGYDNSQLERLERWLKAQKQQLDMDERRGLLVATEGVRRAWGAHVERSRKRLERVGQSAAAQIARECQLPPTVVPKVKAAIDRALRDAMVEVAQDPLGEAA